MIFHADDQDRRPQSQQGKEEAKERITVVPVVNADENDKREFLFIGTVAKPQVSRRATAWLTRSPVGGGPVAEKTV